MMEDNVIKLSENHYNYITSDFFEKGFKEANDYLNLLAGIFTWSLIELHNQGNDPVLALNIINMQVTNTIDSIYKGIDKEQIDWSE